jgi:hypothetical protein
MALTYLFLSQTEEKPTPLAPARPGLFYGMDPGAALIWLLCHFKSVAWMD